MTWWCVRVLNPPIALMECTLDLIISSTGVLDWLAMLANCRHRTLGSDARSMEVRYALAAIVVLRLLAQGQKGIPGLKFHVWLTRESAADLLELSANLLYERKELAM